MNNKGLQKPQIFKKVRVEKDTSPTPGTFRDSRVSIYLLITFLHAMLKITDALMNQATTAGYFSINFKMELENQKVGNHWSKGPY